MKRFILAVTFATALVAATGSAGAAQIAEGSSFWQQQIINVDC